MNTVTGQRIVTKINANPLLAEKAREFKQLRVAAYCRVSTDDEEQLNSYEAQIKYYTETISKNPGWTFAGIYADEGITGTMVTKRKDFLRLMRDCEKRKIDMILTKSISRFARNTVDSLSWVRKLRAMGVGVYFEEQAIDSLKAENEMLIGLFSVIAQSESENISANVKWGIRQSMKNGTFASNFSCYGYKRGENGYPVIVQEQADVVRKIFDLYLDGNSIEQIQNYLSMNHIKTYSGKDIWGREVIRSLLSNEKYAGDLLLQKTFSADCINKKRKINRGELAKYLISNNHTPIIDRDTFNKVQMETARRGSKHKKSFTAITEQGKYSGKYALTDLLVCGECGSHYRRTTKTKNGRKQHVWRCINRIENGQARCCACGAEEKKLHAAICRCLNKLFSNQEEAIELIKSNLAYAVSGNTEALDAYGIENEIKTLMSEADDYLELSMKTGGDKDKYETEIKNIYERIVVLRGQLDQTRIQMSVDQEMNCEIERISKLFQDEAFAFDEYDDVTVRRLVECIRVMKDRRITVVLKGGMQAEVSF